MVKDRIGLRMLAAASLVLAGTTPAIAQEARQRWEQMCQLRKDKLDRILPQAMRVILPSLTNQYLNLTKNSSLAVAVGYPDLVSIANTSLNQTGRAFECVAIIMAVYVSLSLLTAWFMNRFNRSAAQKGLAR